MTILRSTLSPGLTETITVFPVYTGQDVLRVSDTALRTTMTSKRPEAWPGIDSAVPARRLPSARGDKHSQVFDWRDSDMSSVVAVTPALAQYDMSKPSLLRFVPPPKVFSSLGVRVPSGVREELERCSCWEAQATAS